MENNIFCIPRNVKLTSNARLMAPDGKLRRVRTPVTASQIAIGTPGHVVSLAYGLVQGKRVSAMRPAEQLLPGEVYVLLPEDRVGSRMDYRQVSAIRGALRKRKRKRSGGGSSSKVSPYENGTTTTMIEEEEKETGRVSGPTEAVWMPGRPYRWRPLLTTIPESNPIEN